jgi:hypothetical protein
MLQYDTIYRLTDNINIIRQMSYLLVTKLEFVQSCESLHLSKLFDAGHVGTRKHTVFRVLLPARVLLFSVLVSVGTAKCFTKQPQTIPVRSNIRERT